MAVKKSSPLLRLSAGLLALIVLSPLGLLAQGSAWGEWASSELKTLLGFEVEGMKSLEGLWNPRLSDYAIPGWESHFSGPLGYLLCAALGTASCLLVAFLLGEALNKRKRKKEP